MTRNANSTEDNVTVAHLLFTGSPFRTSRDFLKVNTLSKIDVFTKLLATARTVCAAMMLQNARTLFKDAFSQHGLGQTGEEKMYFFFIIAKFE